VSAGVEFNLALILFLPWFAILGTLFWLYPRLPRHPMRGGYNLAVLVMALVLSWTGMRWGLLNADPSAGAIWKQVLATLVAYGIFLAVVTVAWLARGKIFTPRR
jgi:hypothetical protein